MTDTESIRALDLNSASEPWGSPCHDVLEPCRLRYFEINGLLLRSFGMPISSPSAILSLILRRET